MIVNIHDARGHLVEARDLGNLAAAGSDGLEHLWRWSPGAGAASLPAGVYWFDFRAGAARAVRRGVFIK